MLVIRLARMGAKKKPTYRVVVIEKERARDGRFHEIVGQYNPLTTPPTVHLETARIQYWMEKGAQPSETVKRLLDRKSTRLNSSHSRASRMPSSA